MAFELQDVINDPDLGEPFTILRSTGQFGPGGWQDTRSSIDVFGLVTQSSQKQIESIPEADRVHSMRTFITECPMYVTDETRDTNDGSGTTGSGASDILVWNGVNYRVIGVNNFSNRGGFYLAIAARMSGQ